MIVCVILNHSRNLLLLQNHFEPSSQLSNETNKLFQYWFPYKKSSNLETTYQLAEGLINVTFFYLSLILRFLINHLLLNSKQSLEAEYCRNLKHIEHEMITNDSSSKKCDSITLMRIYSTHLLPIATSLKSTSPRATYFLCVLTESCKLNFLKDSLENNPNEISNDNLDKNLIWMDLNNLKLSQRNYELLGLEPILVYKKYIVEAANDQNNNNINLLNSVDNIFYEPKMVYFQEHALNQQLNPAEQLVLSAKFNKISNFDFFFIDYIVEIYFKNAYSSGQIVQYILSIHISKRILK